MPKEIPFWEDGYKNQDVSTFSITPNNSIKAFENLFETDWHILEAGCGEGQNALYLAEQGFQNVEAFDLSENAIGKVKRLAADRNLQLTAFVDDLTTYEFKKKYDLILCFGTLHFVGTTQWKEFLQKAKKYTRVGGIHIMQIFTDKVPASDDIAPFAVGLSKDGELCEVYQDWEILQFQSYVFEDEHLNVPKHLHASNKIVARRMR